MTEQPGDQPTDPTQPESSAPPPPPAAPTPPPEAPGAPAAPAAPAASGASQYDFNQAKATLQGAHKFDLGIMAAGVIAFFAGFMPWYTASISGLGGGSWNAWHGFFGWFGILCALVGAGAVAATMFAKVSLPMPLYQIVTGAFGLASVCLILALFVNPLPSCGGLCSEGHGFGYWLALIVVLAGTALSVLRMREATTTA